MIGIQWKRRDSDYRLEELTKQIKTLEQRISTSETPNYIETLKEDIEHAKEAIIAVLKNKYK